MAKTVEISKFELGLNLMKGGSLPEGVKAAVMEARQTNRPSQFGFGQQTNHNLYIATEFGTVGVTLQNGNRIAMGNAPLALIKAAEAACKRLSDQNPVEFVEIHDEAEDALNEDAQEDPKPAKKKKLKKSRAEEPDPAKANAGDGVGTQG